MQVGNINIGMITNIYIIILQVMNVGNVTIGTVTLIPTRHDDGKLATCRAFNPKSPRKIVEDEIILRVTCKLIYLLHSL